MSTRLARLLEEHTKEILASWLESHLRALSLPDDRDAVVAAHSLAPALIGGLRLGLSSSPKGDLGTFAYREAVQIVVVMGNTLATRGASAEAAGALAPSLVEALRSARVSAPDDGMALRIATALGAVAVRAYVAACRDSEHRARQRKLSEATPVSLLSEKAILVSLCGQPERETMAAIVSRVQALSLRAPRARIIVDASHLGRPGTDGSAEVLALIDDARNGGPRCVVIGADALGDVELEPGERRETVAEALAEVLGVRAAVSRLVGRL